jgi:serine/threonine protein kinase
MPPEVLIGYNEATPKIDVWSLGVIMYGLLIGEMPFWSSDRDELRKQIIEKPISLNKKDNNLTSECIDLLVSMLLKDPHLRIGVREIFEHPWIVKYRNEKLDSAYSCNT